MKPPLRVLPWHGLTFHLFSPAARPRGAIIAGACAPHSDPLTRLTLEDLMMISFNVE